MILIIHNSSQKEIGICYDNKYAFLSPSLTIELHLQSNIISFFINEPSYVKRTKTNFKLIKNIEYFDGYYLKVEALYQIESNDEVIHAELSYVKGINEDVFSDASETYEVIVPCINSGNCTLLSLNIKDKETIYEVVRAEEKQKIETAKKNKKVAGKTKIDKTYKIFLIFSLSSPIAFFVWIFMREFGVKNKLFIFLIIMAVYVLFAIIAVIGNKMIDLLIGLLKPNKKSDTTKNTEEKSANTVSSQLDLNVEKIFDEKHIRSVLQNHLN